MRDYEVTLVIQPLMEEEARNQLIERVGNILVPGEKEGNLNVHHWGQRQLANTIKKHTEGYYVHYEAKMDSAQLPEFEQLVRYNENILRYLVVRKGE